MNLMKNLGGKGPLAYQFFWSFQKGTRTFNIHLNEPFLDLGQLGYLHYPWKQIQKTTTHP